jgi:hypothetical protein
MDYALSSKVYLASLTTDDDNSVNSMHGSSFRRVLYRRVLYPEALSGVSSKRRDTNRSLLPEGPCCVLVVQLVRFAETQVRAPRIRWQELTKAHAQANPA